jgi:hypothetical protein
MLFFNLLPLFCLLGGAFSLPVDLGSQSVPAEIHYPRIISILSRLDRALKEVPSGGSVEEAVRRTDELISMQRSYSDALWDGSRDILKGQAMGPPDGMRMRDSILQVGKLLQSTMSGWVFAKKMVAAAGKQSNAYRELTIASDATTIFGDAFVSKMPPAVHNLGKSFSKDCKGYVELAVKAYKS